MANQIEAKSGNLTGTWNRESGELIVRVDGETLAPQQWQPGKFIELGDDLESRSDDLRAALEQAAMATVKKYRCGRCGAWRELEPCDRPGKAWAGEVELAIPDHGGILPEHSRASGDYVSTTRCPGSGQPPAEAGPQSPLYIEAESD